MNRQQSRLVRLVVLGLAGFAGHITAWWITLQSDYSNLTAVLGFCVVFGAFLSGFLSLWSP